eukprot:360890-Alexandrium_andersonii.AAC.1
MGRRVDQCMGRSGALYGGEGVPARRVIGRSLRDNDSGIPRSSKFKNEAEFQKHWPFKQLRNFAAARSCLSKQFRSFGIA